MVLQQPIDGVVSVAAFVDFARIPFFSPVRRMVNEFPFRLELAADILVGEDVSLAREERRGTQGARELAEP